MRLLSIALILLSFSSCVSYQYLTLNSPEMPKNDKKEFSWENDTMRLTYNFHGEGGPITMTVFNKTDKPLFVNWKKSSLIRGGESFSLLDHSVQITGGYSGSSTGGRRSSNAPNEWKISLSAAWNSSSLDGKHVGVTLSTV